jgi:hypothetical protein
LVDTQLVATKIDPIEREIVWKFIKGCFEAEQQQTAILVFKTIEDLLAARLYADAGHL